MVSLIEEHRTVILESRLLGMSHAEIAERMGKSETATRALLFRALAKLSDRLALRGGAGESSEER
ncbi:MAG: sigma-70 region 4 domain-containing protein [Planctomycetes bacterium]|nr:sigma-70 region 4 domain-containing protein [Planctomycetota bacterium]